MWYKYLGQVTVDPADFLKRCVIFNANRLTRALNELYATNPDPRLFVYNFGAIMHYMTTAFFSIDLTAPDALTRIFARKQVADDSQELKTNEKLFKRSKL
jgi:hypothetical protein